VCGSSASRIVSLWDEIPCATTTARTGSPWYPPFGARHDPRCRPGRLSTTATTPRCPRHGPPAPARPSGGGSTPATGGGRAGPREGARLPLAEAEALVRRARREYGVGDRVRQPALLANVAGDAARPAGRGRGGARGRRRPPRRRRVRPAARPPRRSLPAARSPAAADAGCAMLEPRLHREPPAPAG
jgi:hypothetical protein